MARVSVGGDPEEYMQAPRLSAEDKEGGGSFIAGLLDMLGIHRQVAKPPKGQAAKNGETASTTQSVPQTANVPSLDIAESVFQRPAEAGQAEDWGAEYLRKLNPIKTIDPNVALKGI